MTHTHPHSPGRNSKSLSRQACACRVWNIAIFGLFNCSHVRSMYRFPVSLKSHHPLGISRQSSVYRPYDRAYANTQSPSTRAYSSSVVLISTCTTGTRGNSSGKYGQLIFEIIEFTYASHCMRSFSMVLCACMLMRLRNPYVYDGRRRRNVNGLFI